MRKYAVINECGDERCGRLEEMHDGALVSFKTVQELAEACLHAVGYCCAHKVRLDGPPLDVVRAKLLEIVGRPAKETTCSHVWSRNQHGEYSCAKCPAKRPTPETSPAPVCKRCNGTRKINTRQAKDNACPDCTDYR